jgi:hypothetical protein
MELLWLTPVLVVAITLAQRRLGDRVGGRLAALPVTSTALIAIAALDRGAAMAQSVATGSLAGAPVAVVCLVALRRLATRAMKGAFETSSVPKAPFTAVDLVVRVGVTTACVAGLSMATHVLPPGLAGVLGAFPALACVLTIMTNHRVGPRAARDLVTGVLVGTPASLAFLTTLTVTLGALPVPIAFAAAAVAASAGQYLGDRVHAQVEVSLGDHQGRCDPQRGVVRFLAQHAAAHELLAHLAGDHPAWRDLDARPQAAPAHLGDAVADELLQSRV